LEGGLDDHVGHIVTQCKKKNIPIVFALKKRTLGHAMGKNQKVSAVGVTNPEGAFETFQSIIKMAENGKRLFREQELNPVVLPPPVDKPKK
jgi:ribosomal protein L7Ae-like RNA K-turn-binding protein